MEDRNGKFIISKICERLKEKSIPLNDSCIVKELQAMNKYEVSQLISFGEVCTWKNSRINAQNKETEKQKG
jgi:hypothetical protein